MSIKYKARKRLVAIEYQQYQDTRQLLLIHALALPFYIYLATSSPILHWYPSTCLRKYTLILREQSTALTSTGRNKMPQQQTSINTKHGKQPLLQHIGCVHNDKKVTSACQDDMADELRRLSCNARQIKNDTHQHGQWHPVDRFREVGETRTWLGVAYVASDRQTQLKNGSGKTGPGSKRGSSVATERGSV